VFIVVSVHFVMDSVRKLLDTSPYFPLFIRCYVQQKLKNRTELVLNEVSRMKYELPKKFPDFVGPSVDEVPGKDKNTSEVTFLYCWISH